MTNPTERKQILVTLPDRSQVIIFQGPTDVAILYRFCSAAP